MREMLYSAGGLSPPRTPVSVSSSTSLLSGRLLVKFVLVGDTRTVFTRRGGRARVRSSPASEVFRSQVFFDNGPSSSTSLLPLRGKESLKDGWLWGCQRIRGSRVINQPCPSKGE